MARRSLVSAAVCVLGAALLSANALSAFASGEPQESFLYQNFVRASEVLDRAIAAHGGAELLDRGINIRVLVHGYVSPGGPFRSPLGPQGLPN